jgi:serine/threonine protein kinase
VTVRPGELYRERYQVLASIGEGAFARVFRARETATGRDVALKVLKEGQSQDVMERFQREVFAVASISSPHVVSLLDFGISDDEFYIVMEFVEGPSLRDLLGTHEPWAAEDVLVVVGQIAHALAAAHKHQIVHRDLKPENVMLVERGGAWQTKVLDFGFAKLADLERRLELAPITRVGFCFGTPQYLSPEQIRGLPIDGGADLFALGVIAYEMLAGRRPWDGASAREVMTAVMKTLPPPVLTLHPSLRGRIEEVNAFLLRVLEKERDERPKDAVEFFEELQTALFGGAQAAKNALAGARPVSPRLEDVTSRSISVKATRTSERQDATEIDPVRRPASHAPGNDTVRETAIDSSAIRVDGGSDIPIFVATRGERLISQYLPPIEIEDADEPRAKSADDSRKATLPRGAATATIPKARNSTGRLLVTFLVLVLLAVAFLAGRYLKF